MGAGKRSSSQPFATGVNPAVGVPVYTAITVSKSLPAESMVTVRPVPVNLYQTVLATGTSKISPVGSSNVRQSYGASRSGDAPLVCTTEEPPTARSVAPLGRSLAGALPPAFGPRGAVWMVFPL